MQSTDEITQFIADGSDSLQNYVCKNVITESFSRTYFTYVDNRNPQTQNSKRFTCQRITEVSGMDQQHFVNMFSELAQLQKFKCPSIIKLEKIFINESAVFFEHLTSGFYSDDVLRFNALQRSKIAFGIASALDLMHQHQIYHRSFNFDAVLLDFANNPRLCDFSHTRGQNDLARDQNQLKISFVPGYEMFIPPEVAMHESPNQNSGKNYDIYAFSMFLIYLLNDGRSKTWPIVKDGDVILSEFEYQQKKYMGNLGSVTYDFHTNNEPLKELINCGVSVQDTRRPSMDKFVSCLSIEPLCPIQMEDEKEKYYEYVYSFKNTDQSKLSRSKQTNFNMALENSDNFRQNMAIIQKSESENNLDANYAIACIKVGRAYSIGNGVIPSLDFAINYYNRAISINCRPSPGFVSDPVKYLARFNFAAALTKMRNYCFAQQIFDLYKQNWIEASSEPRPHDLLAYSTDVSFSIINTILCLGKLYEHGSDAFEADSQNNPQPIGPNIYQAANLYFTFQNRFRPTRLSNLMLSRLYLIDVFINSQNKSFAERWLWENYRVIPQIIPEFAAYCFQHQYSFEHIKSLLEYGSYSYQVQNGAPYGDGNSILCLYYYLLNATGTAYIGLLELAANSPVEYTMGTVPPNIATDGPRSFGVKIVCPRPLTWDFYFHYKHPTLFSPAAKFEYGIYLYNSGVQAYSQGVDLNQTLATINEAIVYLTEAANLRHNGAAYTLGTLLLDSRFIKHKPTTALEWFKSAAYTYPIDQYSVMACIEMAKIYLIGEENISMDGPQAKFYSDRGLYFFSKYIEGREPVYKIPDPFQVFNNNLTFVVDNDVVCSLEYNAMFGYIKGQLDLVFAYGNSSCKTGKTYFEESYINNNILI